ncbi:MAG: hypothetical protein HY819_08110 [Acidobacteria bacterium]|nr:hypothetical protein [Acidobacteriota bacterium]
MNEIVYDTIKKLLDLSQKGELRWHASTFWGKGYTTVYKNIVLRIEPDKLELSNAEGEIARVEERTCGSSITPYLADLYAAARRAVSNYKSIQMRGVDSMMEDLCKKILED